MSVPLAQFADHAGPWSEDEFWALPETRGQRVELLDGSLLVSPAPKSEHQQLARRLANLLEAGVPTGWDVIVEVNVRLSSGRILIPDVVVARVQKDAAVYEPPDLVLVAEVASPSTRAQDLLLKLGLYETAGIPGYLLVEHDTEGGPRLLLYRLEGHRLHRARPGPRGRGADGTGGHGRPRHAAAPGLKTYSTRLSGAARPRHHRPRARRAGRRAPRLHRPGGTEPLLGRVQLSGGCGE